MLEELLAHVTRSTGALGVYLITFWKADDQLTEQGRKHIYANLANITGSAQAPLALMDRYFHREMPFFQFAKNTLLFSCASLLIMTILYISLIPNFFGSLTSDEFARRYFLRQLVTNGLPIVILVNYVGFSLYAAWARPEQSKRSAFKALAIDIPVRLALFFLLSATIYISSAQMFGSFGGDTVKAIRAVGPTITLASSFGNLTGVYLYATAISAFPLFISALIELMQISPAFSRFIRCVFFYLPFENRPIRSLAAVFGIFFAIFAAVVSGVASLF